MFFFFYESDNRLSDERKQETERKLKNDPGKMQAQALKM